MTVAVLALQGAFIEHENMVARLGESCVELREEKDLSLDFDRLILPGGESTTQRKLLIERKMLAPLRERIENGMPVLGTCAGLILLADEVEGGEVAFGTLPVRVVRNGYGRQSNSFHVTGSVSWFDDVPMTFIRAPYVTDVGEGASVLSRVGDRIVAVQAGNQIGVAFHPELSDDPRIHLSLLSF